MYSETHEEFECKICMCDVSMDLVYAALEPQCGHLFCLDCIQDHFNREIKNGGSRGIKCPGEGCMKTPSQDEVVYYLGTDSYQKYFENEKQFYHMDLAAGEKLIFCPKDSYCAIYNPEKVKEFKCEICKWKMCS